MNKSDLSRNGYMLTGALAKKGYDWWWHSFMGFSRKTEQKRAFFVEYFVMNPALGKERPIWGQMPEKRLPSYVMVKAGAWGEGKKQLHAFFPISEMTVKNDPLTLSVSDCKLTERTMQGHVSVNESEAKRPEMMCDAGTMDWDLKMNKLVAFNVGYGAGKFFRALNAFAMFWHAEGMKTEYKGTVTFDGEIYDVDPKHTCGYADKNWGKDFTSPWVWISSCNITSNITGKKLTDTVFDIGGGRPIVFGRALERRLLMDIFYEDKDYEFSFSKFWTRCKTTFDCHETETEIIWDIHTQNRKAAMDIFCSCPKSEMLLVNYEAPDGRKRHNRLWNGGTGNGTIKLYKKQQDQLILIDDMNFCDAGCEYGEYTE
jgi:tocopherol cyclase